MPAGARVVEWYAGVGALGLSVAPAASWVRCSDVNPPRDAFAASRALLPPAARARVSYAVGAAAERVHDAAGAEVAIVDPPRKGLDPPLLRALCESEDSAGPCASLRTLVYVSCGFAALAAELDALVAAGWRVRGGGAQAWVLFQDADHIETLVVFDRDVGTSGGDAAVAEEPAPARTPAHAAQPRRRPSASAAPRWRDATSPRGRKLAAKRRKRDDAGPADERGSGG